MNRAVLVALLLAGCDPVWQVRAKVTDPAGAPVTGAALAITCPASPGLAALTDEHGAASVGNLGWDLPAQCTITVAHPGRRTYRVTIEELCAPHEVKNCYRVRNIEVVLAPE